MLKIKAKGMSEWDRLTVLSFDEIYISNKVSIDQANQQVVGPHRACQVIMARGLVGKWKQPVYYDYDRNMTKEIMFDIISRLYHSSLIVIAVTSDMGTGNIGFWNQVGIGFNKNVYFFHPEDDNLKIHVFADVPHRQKLARNHFWIMDLQLMACMPGKIVDSIKVGVDNCFQNKSLPSRYKGDREAKGITCGNCFPIKLQKQLSGVENILH
jgi:hypothetical protein